MQACRLFGMKKIEEKRGGSAEKVFKGGLQTLSKEGCGFLLAAFYMIREPSRTTFTNHCR